VGSIPTPGTYFPKEFEGLSGVSSSGLLRIVARCARICAYDKYYFVKLVMCQHMVNESDGRQADAELGTVILGVNESSAVLEALDTQQMEGDVWARFFAAMGEQMKRGNDA
jgi:hypothetical protein